MLIPSIHLAFSPPSCLSTTIPRQQRSWSFILKALGMIPIGQQWQLCKVMLLTSWHHTLNHNVKNLAYPTNYASGRLTAGQSTNQYSFVVGCKSIIHGLGFITFLPIVLVSSSHVMLEFRGFSNLLSGGLLFKTLSVILWNSWILVLNPTKLSLGRSCPLFGTGLLAGWSMDMKLSTSVRLFKRYVIYHIIF